MPLAAARVFARRNMPACPPAAFRLLPAARGWTENDACLWRVAMSIANRKPQTANRNHQPLTTEPIRTTRRASPVPLRPGPSTLPHAARVVEILATPASISISKLLG
ncbi:hypothetical protein B9D88_019040 [Burkholderia pseudomallei]|nr:hypothetical protein B9D88_019040 [Burkholderia pseudomallei]